MFKLAARCYRTSRTREGNLPCRAGAQTAEALEANADELLYLADQVSPEVVDDSSESTGHPEFLDRRKT